MAKPKLDLTGQKFGRLSVLHRESNPVDPSRAYWVCRCDCGAVKTVYMSSLRKGLTKSCGCLQKEISREADRINDLTGKKFGRLLVLCRGSKPPKVATRAVYWDCRCECGTTKTVLANSLQSGHTQSCGCLQREVMSVRCELRKETALKLKAALLDRSGAT